MLGDSVALYVSINEHVFNIEDLISGSVMSLAVCAHCRVKLKRAFLGTL